MIIKFSQRVDGNALYSENNYKKGEVIFILEGEILDKPNKYTIEIEKDKHILDKWGIYMNHSFSPSTEISGNKVIALIDIVPGIEVNFNYNLNETSMTCPFITNEGLQVSGIN